MRKEPLIVTEKMRRQIRGAFAEIDLAQIKILKTLTPAESVRQACGMVTSAHKAAAYQLCQREPSLTETEALKIVRSNGLIQRALRQKQHE